MKRALANSVTSVDQFPRRHELGHDSLVAAMPLNDRVGALSSYLNWSRRGKTLYHSWIAGLARPLGPFPQTAQTLVVGTISFNEYPIEAIKI